MRRAPSGPSSKQNPSGTQRATGLYKLMNLFTLNVKGSLYANMLVGSKATCKSLPVDTVKTHINTIVRCRHLVSGNEAWSSHNIITVCGRVVYFP